MEWSAYPAARAARWQRIGPGGGGALYAPTVSPHDPSTVIAACDMSSSYLTIDGGKSWRQIDFQHWARFFCFDPADPRRIYAGANALFRSEDGGSTWELLFPRASRVSAVEYRGDEAQRVYVSDDGWPAGRIEAIAVDREDSSRLAVGVSVPRGRTHAEAGARSAELHVYTSGDRGAAWNDGGIVEGGRFIELVYWPGEGLVAISDTAIAVWGGNGRRHVPAVGPHGGIVDAAWGAGRISLVVAPAAGGVVSLFRAAGPLGPWEQRAFPGVNVARIAVCESAPDTVYASVPEPSGFPLYGSPAPPSDFGIIGSSDGGNTWEWKLRIGECQPANRAVGWVETDFPTTWGGAPFDLGVSPRSPAVCYAVDWGTLYRTLDGGASWEQVYTDRGAGGAYVSRGLDTTNAYGIFADPAEPASLLLASTDIGLFRSADEGRSWRHSMRGVPHEIENTCYWIEFDPRIPGRAWSAWGDCHDLPRAKMFASGRFPRYRGCLCRSDDGGRSWIGAAQELGPLGPVTHVVVDPTSPAARRTILAAEMGGGVLVSRDGGTTWERSFQGLRGDRAAWKIVPDGAGRIYLLTARVTGPDHGTPGGLFLSDDAGRSWKELLPRADLPVSFPHFLHIDSMNHDILYLACWPENATASGDPRGGGLLSSGDRGISWDRLLDERLHVYAVAGLPGRPETLFATLFEGAVLRSDDRGKTWGRLGGIDFAWPKTVAPDGHGGIYLSTFGSGVWRGPAEGTGEEGPPPVRAR